MDVDVTLDMLRTIETQAPQLLEVYRQQTYVWLGVAGVLLIISLIIGVYIFAEVRRYKKLSEHCLSFFEFILDYYFGRLLVAILLAAFALVLLSSGLYNLYMINFFPHEFLLNMLFSQKEFQLLLFFIFYWIDMSCSVRATNSEHE